MEPALGRRLVRPALTLGTALPALAAVALWGDPAWAREYALFVAVTTGAVVVAAIASRGFRAERATRPADR